MELVLVLLAVYVLGAVVWFLIATSNISGSLYAFERGDNRWDNAKSAKRSRFLRRFAPVWPIGFVVSVAMIIRDVKEENRPKWDAIDAFLQKMDGK